MMNMLKNRLMSAFLCLAFVAGAFLMRGDSMAAVNCLTLPANASQDDRKYCEAEMQKLEAEYAELMKQKEALSKQTSNYANEVKSLNTELAALDSKIKARNLAIAQLSVEVREKVSTIGTLSQRIDKHHESIAQLLRNVNDFDNAGLVHLVLSDKSLTEFYSDLESYSSIKSAVKVSVDELRGVKHQTEFEKRNLEAKQNAENDAKYGLQEDINKVKSLEQTKKQLLANSQNQEAATAKLAAEKKATADRIRAALFPLRDSQAIPFGTALSYAEEAQKRTGVRPALVLAILRQESNLGANVGTCNRLTDPPEKSWDKIMHPTRDTGPYQRITTALGIPLVGTPLSCAQSVGYGGAMGPSQFIPSTWELFASKIAAAVGITGMPDPWNPRHAITATSLYLGELGAGAGGYTAERNAACRYYSGSACPATASSTRASAIISYGNNVMALVSRMQADIDLLSY